MSVTIILTPIVIPLMMGALAASAAGTSVVVGSIPITLTNDAEQQIQKKKCFTRPTITLDRKILREAVESLGGTVVNSDFFRLNGVEFALRQEPLEIFVWNNEFTEQQANDFISGLEAEYIRIVRDNTLANVSEHCKECGLELESEEVQEDQTVVLTFRV